MHKHVNSARRAKLHCSIPSNKIGWEGELTTNCLYVGVQNMIIVAYLFQLSSISLRLVRFFAPRDYRLVWFDGTQ